jgi:hypothetical protein
MSRRDKGQREAGAGVETGAGVKNAENALGRSLERFESAMESLANRVEHTSRSVQHMLDLATQQKNEILGLRQKAFTAVQPVMPYLHQAEAAGHRVAARVRANPRPFVLAAIGLIAGIAALSWFQGYQGFGGGTAARGHGHGHREGVPGGHLTH